MTQKENMYAETETWGSETHNHRFRRKNTGMVRRDDRTEDFLQLSTWCRPLLQSCARKQPDTADSDTNTLTPPPFFCTDSLNSQRLNMLSALSLISKVGECNA